MDGQSFQNIYHFLLIIVIYFYNVILYFYPMLSSLLQLGLFLGLFLFC